MIRLTFPVVFFCFSVYVRAPGFGAPRSFVCERTSLVTFAFISFDCLLTGIKCNGKSSVQFMDDSIRLDKIK